MLIILFLALLNLVGFTLRYFDLDRYIILLGFRFHVAAVLPFTLLLIKKEFSFIKGFLKVNVFSKFGIYVIAIILPLFVIAGAYLLNYVSITDPDYFYEFGLSSIVDYPVYLLWNLPQLIMVGLFLLYASGKSRFSFPAALTSALFLFPYEFIPTGKEIFQVFPVIQTSILILFASTLLILLKKNIYMSSAIIFTVIWSGVLLFGSLSKTIINLFFARNYDSWEGFITAVKHYENLNLMIFSGLSLIFILVYLIVNSIMKKSD